MSVLAALQRPPRTTATGKALRLPLPTPLTAHGRMFLFSTLSFTLSFLAWYSIPPLLTTLTPALHLTPRTIADSHILALTATLLVRVASGPLIDRYGPRRVYVGLLILGAVPTGLTGAVGTPAGFLAVRVAVGVLGGTFVPCQVWAAEWFDAGVVGAAAGVSAGVGNAGGGLAYFVMPALARAVGWRAGFAVPAGAVVAAAAGMAWACADTPGGVWRRRGVRAERWAEVGSWRTALVALPYAMTFGGELAVNAVLGAWLQRNLAVSQTGAGRLASTFMLANVLFRPLGGYLSDVLSVRFSLAARKHLLLVLTVLAGLALVVLGVRDPRDTTEFMGLIILLAAMMDAANGSCFALVQAMTREDRRGVVSGAVGGAGNLGGVLAAVVLRFCGWERGCWGWGIGTVVVGIGLGWIGVSEPEDEKHQIEE